MASWSSSCGSLPVCCRQSPDAWECNCYDCTSATSAQASKQDANSICRGVCQTSCLGFNQCSEKPVENEAPVAQGSDDGPPSDAQAQVFTFHEQLGQLEKKELDRDYNKIPDVFLKNDFFDNCKIEAEHADRCVYDVPQVMDWDRKMAPKIFPGANVTYLERVPDIKVQVWRSLGLDMYGKGYVAIVIMCGGKDSRVGQGVPKAILDFGLLSGKSILQVYVERIRRLQTLVARRLEGEATVAIPLYIMCNEDNFDILSDFFLENKYFGLKREQVTLFKQKMSPLFDNFGRFVLAEKHKIHQEPCGNGYLVQALTADGVMQDIKSRCATHIYVISVDNVLGKIGDPTFIGFCKQIGVEAGIKTTRKRSPNEALGVLTTRKETYYEDLDGDGEADLVTKLRGINLEFFEMPESVKSRKLHAGTTDLAYDSGNLSQYVFKISFMRKVAKHMSNKWHLVPKSAMRINYVTGDFNKPQKGVKNAFRPETFIFDSFEFTKGVAAFQVPREEYAVIKNMRGQDSPQTALASFSKLHQQWIMTAGGEFVGSKIATDRDDAKCEVSPLVSYDGEDLKGQFWMPIELPFYLPSQSELEQTSAVELDTGKEESLHFLDKDAVPAKMAVEAELKFQIESLFAGKTDGGTGHDYDKADPEEMLPPTPKKKKEVKEKKVVEKVVERKKRAIDPWADDPDKHLMHFDEDEIETSDNTHNLLSKRSASSDHYALQSRRRHHHQQEGASKKDKDKDNSKYGRQMPGTARATGDNAAGVMTKGGKVYTARAALLGEHWDGEAPSLRCLPPGQHGVEKSEFGRRKQTIDYGLHRVWSAQNQKLLEKGKRNSAPGDHMIVDATNKSGKELNGGLECAVS